MKEKQSKPKDELILSRAICEALRPKIESPRVEIRHNEHVLIGITCGWRNAESRLLFQSARQDICICLKSPHRFEGQRFFCKFRNSLPTDEILIPLLIFELKLKGDNKEGVNTHTVRQYSEVARLIKSIFPFCAYNLILANMCLNKEEVDKIYMAAKYFNRIVYKPDLDCGDLTEKNATYSEFLSEIAAAAQEHIKYLQNEDFFRLKAALKTDAAQAKLGGYAGPYKKAKRRRKAQ